MTLFPQIVFILNLVVFPVLAQSISKSSERLADDVVYKEQVAVLRGVNSNFIKNLVVQASKTVPVFDEAQAVRFERPLDLGVWWWYPKAYGFQRFMSKSTIHWGLWKSQGYDLLALKMNPSVATKKLVVFAHGYLDHAAGTTNFYQELLNNGIALATFDLPGHGLSSGLRGSIDDFETYAKILGEFVERFQGQYEEIVLVGFSTGGSSILEARRLGLVPKDTRVALISPLVRVKHHWIVEPAFLAALNLRLGLNWSILDLVIYPDRWIRDVSHDPLYMDFLRTDPISPPKIPTAWTLAYIEYANRFQKWAENLSSVDKASFGATLMIQGMDDQVVEAAAGMDMISRTFPQAKIIEIQGGYHALLNEGELGSTDLLPQVYGPVLDFIKAQ